jgi:hypothetical protein
MALFNTTDGATHDIVCETPRDGLSALRNLRIHNYSKMRSQHTQINEILASRKFLIPEKKEEPPINFIRRLNIFFSIYNGFGKNEKSDEQMRDQLFKTLAKSDKYSVLRNHLEMVQETYDALTYTVLKQKIIAAHDDQIDIMDQKATKDYSPLTSEEDLLGAALDNDGEEPVVKKQKNNSSQQVQKKNVVADMNGQFFPLTECDSGLCPPGTHGHRGDFCPKRVCQAAWGTDHEPNAKGKGKGKGKGGKGKKGKGGGKKKWNAADNQSTYWQGNNNWSYNQQPKGKGKGKAAGKGGKGKGKGGQQSWQWNNNSWDQSNFF